MHSAHFHHSAEHNEEKRLVIPAESLFDKGTLRELWPATLLDNPEFTEQIAARKRLIDALAQVQTRADDPSADLEDLLSSGDLSEGHVADLYEALADTLERSPEYGRIVLYLPFEYLPSAHARHGSERLAAQATRFRDAYKKTWERLLWVQDVRANFVDGDVLETDKRTGDLPRVAKAAHLIPFLVRKGLLSADEVLALRDGARDGTLRESIEDTFGLLRTFGLADERFGEAEPAPQDAGEREEPRPLEPSRMRNMIEERISMHDGESPDDTAKRRAWLASVRTQRAIDDAGDDVRAAVLANLINDDAVKELMRPDAHLPSQSAFVDGVRKAVERAATGSAGDAEALYARYHEPLRTLWERQQPATRPHLEKLFFRLHNLGIIDAATLDGLGLAAPNLGGPFLANARRMDTETDDARRMLDAIRNDPELARTVYPIVLLYGSRLKGYGTKEADVDLGVFVKPSVPGALRAEVRGLLMRALGSGAPRDAALEFWLEESTGGLAVRDFESDDVALGESLSPHVLFGAAWKGDAAAMRELYAKLLPGYFADAGKTLYGHDARELYIESLEKDVLQYRLMHKGYERSHSARNALDGMDASRMDQASAFWDSGYRALATKLFAEKVFLPKL